MSPPKKYMAASVPRFLRTARLGYLLSHSVIGSRITRGDGGVNLIFDIVMLPVNEFQRMRSNVGLQHVIAPMPKIGPTFNPGFVLSDAREVTVPADELDPEGFARNYFMIKFGLIAPEVPVAVPAPPEKELPPPRSPFSEAARECAFRVKTEDCN